MNILLTAGNTQVPIDRVRCITNIFTGKTGALIALEAFHRDHSVTLLTSNPDAVRGLKSVPEGPNWSVFPFQTFEELQREMSSAVKSGHFHAVVHAAAVNDYLNQGVYSPRGDTHFETESGNWLGSSPGLVDRSAGKLKSDDPELWLRLVRAPKLIDFVRSDWHFTGVLVKFKLEVAVSDERLLEIAETSRRHSNADLMVANTLEGAKEWAMVGPLNRKYERVRRDDLPWRLMEAIEDLVPEDDEEIE
ncbi:MAG TPA: phosphopantothenoylcysteine decarboxylase [Gemmataceae bacterium]|jgi:phosphopantothenoylcysteine synthetase/decarboxylase|nr:phosphopantothenoylcysteine decarboxylase [Gemmataceae bacterium]